MNTQCRKRNPRPSGHKSSLFNHALVDDVDNASGHEIEANQNKNKYNTCLKLLSVLTMPIEGIFFFGLLMGFTNLVEIYKELGVYESACDLNDVLAPNDNATYQGFPDENGIVNCNERDFYFSTASTLGVVAMSIFTFPLGVILDNYGCFLSRSLCAILLSIGFLFLMFTEDVNWFLFPGSVFLNAGSYALLVTNLPLADLFPNATALIVIAGQMVFQASSSIPRLWAVVYESGVDLKYIMLFNLTMTLVIWLRSLFLMPLTWVDPELAPFYNSPFYRGTVNPLGDAKSKNLEKHESVSKDEQSNQPVMKYVWTPEFILLMVWASFGNMDITFISFNWSKFARIVAGDDDYLELVDLFGGYLWTAAVFSGLCAILIDGLSTKCFSNRSLMEGKSITIILVIVFDNIAGIVVHILQLLNTYESAYAVIFIYNLYRGLFYSAVAVYIKCNFPVECFGTLIGVAYIAMGIFSLLNIGLTEVLTAYDVAGFNAIAIASGIALLLTLSFPILAIFNKRSDSKSCSEKNDGKEKIEEL